MYATSFKGLSCTFVTLIRSSSIIRGLKNYQLFLLQKPRQYFTTLFVTILVLNGIILPWEFILVKAILMKVVSLEWIKTFNNF